VSQLTESDYSYIRKVSDTAIDVVLPDDTFHFTANAARNGWIPEPGLEDLTLKGPVSGTFTLSDTEGTSTEFAKVAPSATTWQVTSSSVLGESDSTTVIVSETITVDGKTLARPKQLIAATSATTPAACATAPTTKGCRSMEYVYATTATATADTLGDYSGQVKEIRLWSTAPGAANATSKAVQTYAYDNSGRLRQAWNPQISPALRTEYSYDASGRVTKLTEPGEFPWTFTYGRAGNDPAAGEGMLLKASRPGLKPGTSDVVEGEAATSVVYDVLLTGTVAPYKMGRADVRTWGQSQAPLDAAAIFPADTVPAAHTGSALAASDYRRATAHYLDASGRSANTVVPGGHTTTTEHDQFGNVVSDLSAGNRAIALGLTDADKAVQAELGIADLPSAERAALLSTRSVYDASGMRKTEQLGPLSRIELTATLKSGTTTLVAAGSPVVARARTVNEFDAGRPSGTP